MSDSSSDQFVDAMEEFERKDTKISEMKSTLVSVSLDSSPNVAEIESTTPAATPSTPPILLLDPLTPASQPSTETELSPKKTKRRPSLLSIKIPGFQQSQSPNVTSRSASEKSTKSSSSPERSSKSLASSKSLSPPKQGFVSIALTEEDCARVPAITTTNSPATTTLSNVERKEKGKYQSTILHEASEEDEILETLVMARSKSMSSTKSNKDKQQINLTTTPRDILSAMSLSDLEAERKRLLLRVQTLSTALIDHLESREIIYAQNVEFKGYIAKMLDKLGRKGHVKRLAINQNIGHHKVR